MQINDRENFERVWLFTFAVQRLAGVTDALTRWMGAAGGSTAAARPDIRACEADYLAALARTRRLADQHATFLAQPQQGDIGALLTDAAHTLQHMAAVLEQFQGYPSACEEAAALRRDACRCTASCPAGWGPGSQAC